MHMHKDWFLIAFRDLQSAKRLVEVEIFYSAMFHCQQSAEKSLKAYLAFQRAPIKKTHNLVNLIELCCRFDDEFKNLLEIAKKLTPLEVCYRYLSEYEIPEKDDALQALEWAQEVFDFVVKKIESTDPGQLNIFD